MEKIKIIARYTLKELLQSKLVFYTISLSLALTMSTMLLMNLSYEGGLKVLLNLALGLLTVSSVGSAMFFAGDLYIKEINNKTLYMVLGRSVQRFEFILGKLLGLSTMLLLNIIIMSVIVISPYIFFGGELSFTIIVSIFFIFLEAVLVMLILSALSLSFNHLASSIYTICIYLTGHGLSNAVRAAEMGDSSILKILMKFLDLIIPSFYKLSLRNFAVYDQQINISYFFMIFIYIIFYAIFLIGLTINNFRKMDFE